MEIFDFKIVTRRLPILLQLELGDTEIGRHQ